MVIESFFLLLVKTILDFLQNIMRKKTLLLICLTLDLRTKHL